MKLLLTGLWWFGLLALVGLVVSFVLMESSRTGARAPRLTSNPLGNYREEFFNARGKVAREWCARLFIAATISFVVAVGLVVAAGN